MSKNPLERFEALAQRLMEGSLGRLFGGRLDPLEISAELARAIEDNQLDGRSPNQFIVQLHPADYTYVRTQWPDIAQLLGRYVSQIARELQLELIGDPQITVEATPDIGRHFSHIHATHADRPSALTEQFEPIRDFDPIDALTKLDAFVIVAGRRHVPLNKTRLTLGRRSDCDIVLEGRMVSRRHAQLRWRFGRFILYDLGSRSGTFVNGDRVTEFALRPGDVIELAGTSLIYGEGLAETRPVRAQARPEQQVTQVHKRFHIK